MLKIGDVVEFAMDGEFEEYKGNANKYCYDVGTVTQVFPRVKVRWNSNGEITDPALEYIRLLEIDSAISTKESKEDYYLCLTKEEVEIFMNGLSTYKNVYYCSDCDIAQSVIEGLIAFKNKAKENPEEIQKALDLLSKSGYTCTKN